MHFVRSLFVVAILALLPAGAFAMPANPALSALVDGIDNGEEGPQLVLSEMSVAIEQQGPIAEVTIEARITNPSDDEVEARFTMQLPRDAVVTGYALDIGSTMIPGSLIDQPKARQVYEDEVRGNIDPGLAEISNTNRFSTRVYPVAPEGSRRIRLTFVTTVDPATGLTLPLATAGPVAVFRLTATAAGLEDAPVITLGEQRFTLERQGRGWRLPEVVLSEERLSGSLAISGGDPSGKASAVLHSSGRSFFVIADEVEASRLADNPPATVRVYWDASRSRADALHETERSLLATLIGTIAPQRLEAVVFSSAEPQVARFAGSDAAALDAFLSGVTYRGATSLAGLNDVASDDADLCLMFTDGGVSLDHTADFEPSCPLVIVASGPHVDGARIARLAEDGGGMALFLDGDNASEVLSQMQAMPVMVTQVRDESFRRLDFRMLPASEGHVLIVGELGAGSTLQVRLSGVRSGERRRSYALERGPAARRDGAGALWASREVARLSEDPADRERMQRLSREFQVASPTMSFLVLEQPRQYVDADITPPRGFGEEWMKDYRDLASEREEERKRERDERLSQVLREWEDAKEWWDEEFDQEYAMKRASSERDRGGSLGGEVAEEAAASADASAMIPAPPPPPPPPPPAMASTAAPAPHDYAEAEIGGDEQFIVVTGSRVASNDVQDVPVAITALTVEDETGAEVAIELGEVLSDQPYLEALDAAPPEERLAVLAAQEKTYGSLPAFYLDVSEWFRLKGEAAIARELLLSALDLPASDDETTLIVAFRLERDGDFDTAITLLERLATVIDYRTQPKRTLALAIASRGRTATGSDRRDDLERAFELLREVVLEPTDGRYDGMETVALMELNSLIPLIEQAGGKWSIDDRLVARLDTDLRIVIEWTSADADIDLWVREPSGEEGYYGNQRTDLGGKVSNDMTNGYGPEEYVIRKAFPGDYEVRIKGFRGDRINPNGPGRVMVRLIRNFARENEDGRLIDAEISFDRSDEEANDRAVATMTVAR